MDAPDVIPLHRVATALPELLHTTIEAMQKQAEALEVNLTVDAAPDLPLAYVDPDKIAWAVATLVGNSLRYVRHGTRRLPGGVIRVHVAFEAGSTVITVEDDGPGIPAEKVRGLFQRRRGGTHGAGLALLLIQDVVEAHGGTVEVQSRHGERQSGTLVRLRLPGVSHGA
jgi:signal transduction histidine kinase